MTSRLKIAISGKAKSGKNLVANLLIKHFGLSKDSYRLRAFANPMKEIACIMFPMADKAALYGESDRRSEIISNDYLDVNGNPLTYRQFLCDLGKFGRQYNQKIWINCLDADYKENKSIIYLIPDARFKDEFAYLKDNGFTLVRVKRNNMTTINDISETEQEEMLDSFFNYVIENYYSIDVLEDDISSIANNLLYG